MKKGTWIIFGLVLVLGLLYFLSRESQVSVGVKQLKLPTVTQDKIDRIEILGKNPVELVKRDDGWKVKLAGENAREVPADQANVQALFDAAGGLRSSHYVTNLKEKYTELGFDENTAVPVKLYAKDNVVFSLVLGKNASGAGRYAKLPDEDDVFVVRGSFWQLTRNGAVDFRDREVWPVKEGEAELFTIMKSDGTEIALVKKDAGVWAFDENQGLPKNFRVDQNALANLVRTAASLRATNFVDEAKTLSSPSITLKAGSKTGSYVLEIFSDDNNKVLARRVGDDQVYEISKHSFDRLNQPVDALRELTILKFDRASVRGITLKHGKDTVVVKKEENQWRIIEPAKLPEKFEFDPNTVDDLLTLLSGLNAERVISSKDVPVSSDWQKQWLVELVTDKDEKIHLYAGKIKASKDEMLVRGNIDQDIYVVKAMRLSSLQSGVNAFKKEEFELPPIDENTKGFESLPVDIQRKLLNVTKEKKGN